MTDAQLPPSDDQALDPDDDTLPPEHPVGSDPPVSAGEVLSGEGIGIGTGIAGAGRAPVEPERPLIPDDNS